MLQASYDQVDHALSRASAFLEGELSGFARRGSTVYAGVPCGHWGAPPRGLDAKLAASTDPKLESLETSRQ